MMILVVCLSCPVKNFDTGILSETNQILSALYKDEYNTLYV